ncbi:phosphoglycerate mutase-like protein [Mollisia scopiformis]|uniref:Phosphoglycerate mutase-like protein n=1 Tax=Mollisia scopiformis TaxID=149040 RepID=A0A194XR13_MOLSC|nr:phosphoglycerate mutase-like protein [Mollisia scopiformis]KUJ22494.1 phosphoglycerate mutase-like protein [Mollisia scopiformis]
MAPTVILIRHAEALHNVSQHYDLHDPALTDLGFGKQCDDLANHLQSELPLAQKIDLIVVSPMRRTIQTAQQGLGWLMKRGVPVILRAEWQENSAKPCDTGTAIPIMEKEWPQFDWSLVDPEYPTKEGLYEWSRQGLTERGIAAKKWLSERPEKVIAVVSHSGFLRVGITNGKLFENADYRIFDFGKDLELKEWELTETKGGGLGKSMKDIKPMGLGDYPERVETELKEGVNENPS